MTATRRIPLPEAGTVRWLCGPREANLTYIEAALRLEVRLQGNALEVTGDAEAVDLAERLIVGLWPLAADGEALTPDRIGLAIDTLRSGGSATLEKLVRDAVVVAPGGKAVRARTAGQAAYVEAIATNTLTFGLGPAGTGKTYLAAAVAVRALRDRQVGKIILTRPAIEAGESLGYLPGDFQAKVDPYFRPLYDAMGELLGTERFTRHVERGMIEVAPLAYMRGRTLNEAFIILDEAQNTTPEQMKMFLTRIGHGSRVVVTGDVSQVDLPRGKRSGLLDMERLLAGIGDIAFVHFARRDVVRHALVGQIVAAYEAHEAAEAAR